MSKRFKEIAKQLGVRYLFGRWGVSILPRDPNGKVYKLVNFTPLDGWVFEPDEIKQTFADDPDFSISYKPKKSNMDKLRKKLTEQGLINLSEVEEKIFDELVRGWIVGVIPEKKLNDTSSLGLDQIKPEHHERNGYNQAIDEIRRRAGIGGDKNG